MIICTRHLSIGPQNMKLSNVSHCVGAFFGPFTSDGIMMPHSIHNQGRTRGMRAKKGV